MFLILKSVYGVKAYQKIAHTCNEEKPPGKLNFSKHTLAMHAKPTSSIFFTMVELNSMNNKFIFYNE